MTDEEMAEEYAEKHSFRVPYDGSNKFYDDTDFKASKEGFLAGLKVGRQDDQLTKAKELLAKWVELFKPKGGNIPPTPIQIDTEQFLKGE